LDGHKQQFPKHIRAYFLLAGISPNLALEIYHVNILYIILVIVIIYHDINRNNIWGAYLAYFF
jgi:hypothetical protein